MKTTVKTKRQLTTAEQIPGMNGRPGASAGKTTTVTSGNGGKPAELQPVRPQPELAAAVEEQEIEFSLVAPEAKEVKVAGDFNGWQPEVTPLKKTGQGKWVARLKLPSGHYEYRFMVDGQWRDDPQTVERLANPYGGFNAVIRVPLGARASVL